MDKTYEIINDSEELKVRVTETVTQEVSTEYSISQCDDEISKCDMRIQDLQSEISKQLDEREKWSNIKEEISPKIEEAINQKVEEVTNDYSSDVPNL